MPRKSVKKRGSELIGGSHRSRRHYTARLMSAIFTGTLMYFGVGIAANLLSFFVPVCRSYQS